MSFSKKDLLLGVVNGILLFAIGFVTYLFIPANKETATNSFIIALIIPIVVLFVEYFAFKKRFSKYFYVVSYAIFLILFVPIFALGSFQWIYVP